MQKLQLEIINQGQKGISPIIGAFLFEAALYCLEMNKHQSGITLELSGDIKDKFELIWNGTLNEQITNSWKDNKEATEYGATAIGILLANQLTGLEVLNRAEQGNGVDYHLGEGYNIKAHLEISGIWKNTTSNTINIRINKKLKQVERSKDKLPVYVIVTEFGKPQSKFVKYE